MAVKDKQLSTYLGSCVSNISYITTTTLENRNTHTVTLLHYESSHSGWINNGMEILQMLPDQTQEYLQNNIYDYQAEIPLPLKIKQDKYTMDPGSQIDCSNQKILLSKKWFLRKIIKQNNVTVHFEKSSLYSLIST